MNGRSILFLAVVAAAVIVPYRIVHGPRSSGQAARGWWDSMWTDDAMSSSTSSPIPGGSSWFDASHSLQKLPSSDQRGHSQTWNPSTSTAATTASPTGPRFRSLAEILRFDVTPNWVMQQWPLVWTRFKDGDLSGLRVTLVSGTRPTDLAGALTYYFDRQLAAQRIAFQGYTGDPSEVSTVATQQCGLSVEPISSGKCLAIRNQARQVHSGLWIRTPVRVSQGDPLRRFVLEFELTRPGAPRTVSAGFAARLEDGAGLDTGLVRKTPAIPGLNPTIQQLAPATGAEPRPASQLGREGIPNPQ
ncbi:MAG TPA: DUF6690 family protein, partial [Pirellulaceae bacterium]